MSNIYRAELHIPRHPAGIEATQSFFNSLAEHFAISPQIRQDVTLAIEEGLVLLFKQADVQNAEDQLTVLLEFLHDAICITGTAHGQPFDDRRIVVRSKPFSSAEEDVDCLGSYLMSRLMDSVTWRYAEKRGTSLSMQKNLPSPVSSGKAYELDMSETAPVEIVGSLDFRRVSNRDEALALAICAYDVFRYTYKNVVYYPDELLSRIADGSMVSWIAIDEAGTVFGHRALMRKKPEDLIAEIGASFVRRESRKHRVFQTIAEIMHPEIEQMGLHGVYALSVTNHTVTQAASLKVGQYTVGLRIASSPAIFIEGSQPGDRVTTVLNYRSLQPRQPRTIYVPERYRAMVLALYELIKLPVTVADTSELSQVPAGDSVDCEKDFFLNGALITASGGEGAAYKLQALTEMLCEGGIACIQLSLDIEHEGTPYLAEAACRAGYFFSGILPECLDNGHDALQMQLLNHLTVNADGIHLFQDSAKQIMAFIQNEAPSVFV